MTKTILGLSGSLRRASFNAGLLRAAVDLAPEGTRIQTGSIREVPLYDGDLEAATGLPEPVRILQSQLAAADGLLLVTPEYNNGVPGVFKNAIDWMSRGEGLAMFVGKPVAVIGASPGGVRHDPGAEPLAAGAAHAQGRAVDRGAADGVARGVGLRRSGQPDRRQDARAVARLPRRLCRAPLTHPVPQTQKAARRLP